MNDDLNTPMVIATLFDACKVINQANDGNAALSQADIDELKSVFQTYLFRSPSRSFGQRAFRSPFGNLRLSLMR